MSTDCHRNKMFSVVYVMGSGRCGTTLLDAILGNHPDILGAGELYSLARGDSFERIYCPCGSPASKCRFWRATVDEWFRRSRMKALSEYASLQDFFEGPRTRGMGRLMRERRKPSPQFQRYAELTRTLYESLQAVSGNSIVVDSSVLPMRALALSLMPEIDLHLIHLVRDGRGVASSLKKRMPADQRAGVGADERGRPVWRSALTWTAYNLLAEGICRGLPAERVYFCRYEDLVCDTQRVLRGIGDFLGCDFEGVIGRIASGAALERGCTFGGNRMRMNRNVHLRLDMDWTRNLTTREQQIFCGLCGWLMRRYGYTNRSVNSEAPVRGEDTLERRKAS